MSLSPHSLEICFFGIAELFGKWLHSGCGHLLTQHILRACCVASSVLGMHHASKQVKVSVLLKYSSWGIGVNNTLKTNK